MKNIRNILLILFLFSCSMHASAQDEIIKKHPVKKQDLGVKELMLDGMKVIYKPSTKDIISVSMFIKGGTANYPKDQEGIEKLTMSVLAESGSQKYPHDSYHSLLESYGTNIGAQTGEDASQVTMTCLKNKWNESWDIFADLVMHPMFDENTFNNKKEEALNDIKQNESDPDSHLGNMMYNSIFSGTNYNKLIEGTETSIKAMTQNGLKIYYSNLIRKNKAYIVVVGNVSEADLKTKISMLKGIPLGIAPTALTDKHPDFSKSSLYKEERKLATNYIQGTMDAPSPGTPDYVAMKIAVQLLSERLFVEIRTKRNLSYAPYAYLAGLKTSYANMYVSTTDPVKSVQVMIDEVKKLRKEGFNEKELVNKKEGYLTTYYMNLETNAALAGTLGNNENLSTWKNSLKVLDDVQKLTVDDINKAFKKYSNAIRWVYLGDTTLADEKLFNQPLD